MNRDPVGIVGVGNMGGAMAARLLEAGWPVHVCDIDPHRVRAMELQGARVHHTPSQCAAAAAALIVCVVDSPQVETVLFGPSSTPNGTVDLFGALRRAMAKTGYSDLKEFQRVGLTVRG